jgi:hypothetical protein
VLPNLALILWLSEHHLKQLELHQTNLDGYKLATSYCRNSKGVCVCVCIFLHKNLNFLNINHSRYCKEEDIEVCALKLKFIVPNICVLAVYRAPWGNIISFLNGFQTCHSVINSHFKTELKFIICGDINIVYSMDSDKKRQNDAMLVI